MSLTNMTIRAKLHGLAILTVTGFITAGAIYAYSVHLTEEASVENNRVTNIRLVAQEIASGMSQARSHEKDFLLRKAPKYIEKHDKTMATNYDAISRLSALVSGAQEKQLTSELNTRLKAYQSRFKAMVTAQEYVGLRDEVDAIDPVLEKMLALADKLHEKNKEYQQNNSATIATLMAVTLSSIGSIIVVTLLLVLRSIVGPLDKAVKFCEQVSRGDLTHSITVDSQDEVGRLSQSLKAMSENLSRIVGRVKMSTNAIASGSQQISAGNINLSQRTEEQASSLEETAASMEEMTSTVKQNADSAQQANQLANAARNDAEKGGQVVNRTVKAMSEINASSTRIADIISTIDAIAFQTNLLALNAAVEAARAGEQGRGFAVVASEVRTLAQRSADAAKEIKALIEDSVEKVKTGTDLVDESGQTLTGIVDGIKKVADIVAEINAASQEQSAGIDQVNNAVAQMDDMTQQNAALVEESAAASRSMQDQAAGMSELMTFFSVNDSAGLGLEDSYQPKTAIENVPARQVGGGSQLKDRTQEHLDKIRAEKAEIRAHKSGTDGRQEWEDF
ncbi:MAG: hypothetical protein BMS9Abin33_0810 [Gammaproteobacteria bacterium]|nr:MAG: hypothetical protein BMS9Abin33_0810 [Gammaproteobacteria bacterium]